MTLDATDVLLACGPDRARLFQQAPRTVWLTGLSGAGKSTLAFELERRLLAASNPCYVLDGDNVRQGLNRDLGFSPDDRTENIRRVAEVAHLMNEAGLIVIAALLSPMRADRALAKSIIGAGRFVEIYLNTAVSTCEKRDPKGLYRRARSGELSNFTGISAPYETPSSPALIIDTTFVEIDRAATNILEITDLI